MRNYASMCLCGEAFARLNKEPNVQVSDTTGDAQRTKAGNKIKDQKIRHQKLK